MSPRRAHVCLSIASAIVVGTFALPAFAQQTSTISAKEKMDICKFGAQEQKLKGRAEQDFVKKCMANEDASAKPSKK